MNRSKSSGIDSRFVVVVVVVAVVVAVVAAAEVIVFLYSVIAIFFCTDSILKLSTARPLCCS